MSWRVYPRETAVDLVFHPDTPDEPGIWSGTVELHRGAPSPTDHPELLHAFLAVGEHPSLHAEFIRHTWEADIPDTYEGLSNLDGNRRYMTLNASGGDLNWSLVLKLPPETPKFVFKRICEAFRARMKGDPAVKPVEANNPVPKPASLGTAPVPKADPVPSAVKEGINSVVKQGG